jgi:lysophospholipase L1-like esterase
MAGHPVDGRSWRRASFDARAGSDACALAASQTVADGRDPNRRSEETMRGRASTSGILVAAIWIVGALPVAGASPDPSGPTIEPGDPWVVYQGGESLEGTWPIRFVRPDGIDDHLLPLADLPGYDQGHPAWSPDGGRIAFDLFTQVKGSPDRVSVWAVEPDGSDPAELAACTLPCLQLAYPAWSPDGTELALVRYDIEPDGTWGPSAVEVLDLASAERRVLTETADGTTAVFTPRWSPDGSAVVFVIEAYTDATEETVTSSVLATIPTDGSSTTPTVLTSTDAVADSPDWAPNERIAFTRSESFDRRPDASTVATIAADGSDLRVFDAADTGLAFASEPTWTPDGQLLVGTGDPATGVQWLARLDPVTGSAERLPWDLVTATPGVQRAHHHPRPAPTEPPGALLLVGLGDSIPGAGDHERPPTYTCDCESFVTLLGRLAEQALGQPVVVKNLATNDSLESTGLLDRVRTDRRYRSAITAADIITVTIGTNDWQGPCNWPDDDACWLDGLTRVPPTVGSILDEILALRDGQPTAIRLTTYFDPYIGFPMNLTSQGDPAGPMPEAFLDFYRVEEEKFYAALCAEAEARDVTCVDLWAPFNGPSHEESATALLLPDHVHPNQAGHELIAETIADVGFAPLG